MFSIEYIRCAIDVADEQEATKEAARNLTLFLQRTSPEQLLNLDPITLAVAARCDAATAVRAAAILVAADALAEIHTFHDGRDHDIPAEGSGLAIAHGRLVHPGTGAEVHSFEHMISTSWRASDAFATAADAARGEALLSMSSSRTVGELRAILADLDDDVPVVVRNQEFGGWDPAGEMSVSRLAVLVEHPRRRSGMLDESDGSEGITALLIQ